VIVVFIMMEPLADIRPESFAPSVKYPSRRWARFSGTSYSRMIHGTHDPGRRSRIFPAARLRTMAGSSGTGRPHDGLDRPSQIRLLHQVVNSPDNLCRLYVASDFGWFVLCRASARTCFVDYMRNILCADALLRTGAIGYSISGRVAGDL
jgi:hypothetical protein